MGYEQPEDKLMALLDEFELVSEGVFEDLAKIFGRAVTYSDIHTMDEPDRDKIHKYLLDRLEDW